MLYTDPGSNTNTPITQVNVQYFTSSRNNTTINVTKIVESDAAGLISTGCVDIVVCMLCCHPTLLLLLYNCMYNMRGVISVC